MNSTDFFQKLQDQFANNLPFVAYRNPNEGTIKSFLQQDKTLYQTTEFTESGFVFSPFNSKETSILIPVEGSETIQCSHDNSHEILLNSSTSEVYQTINDISAKENHIKLVENGIQQIQKGTFQKVVLSRCKSVTISESNPVVIFKKLLATYPTAYIYVWFHPKVGLWLGATPETLLQIENKN